MMSKEVETFLAANAGKELAHFGVKGMRWGIRRDERKLSDRDKALNISQRSQVKVASAVSALAAIGITSNAAATAFQLQSRWEHLQIVKAVMEQAEHNPLLNDAGREALRLTKNRIVKGLVASAAMTTAVSATIGVVTHRTAKAYFAPLHKVYGDAKPKINADLKKLSKDIKSGKRSSLNSKQYYAEVSKIVEKHITKDKSNMLRPFHELARSQLGLEYNTKKLNIRFEKLPNTDLYSKMTIVTPEGLKLVKAVKNVEHSELTDDDVPFKDLDIYFDYKFDADGYIVEFLSPTLEIANDIVEGQLDLNKVAEQFAGSSKIEHSIVEEGTGMTNSIEVATFLDLQAEKSLEHYGIKGMRWGIRRSDAQLAKASKVALGEGRPNPRSPSDDGARAAAALKSLKKGGIESLSNDDIQHLTNRLRLETSLAEAKAQRVTTLGKLDRRTKRILGYGATMNSVIKFVNSPAGHLVASGVFGKSAGKHVKGLNAIAKAGGGKKKK